jgi:CHAT domain-containing protein/tetratricopeptide (TPR) repeat protein
VKGFALSSHNNMIRDERDMNESLEDQVIIRHYLLGILGDEDKMRQIEEKTLIDDDFSETLSIAEDNLIEEYLDDELMETEREHFTRHFLGVPGNRRKLQFIQNLRQAATKAKPISNIAEKKSSFFNWWKLFSIPAFRFAVLALIVFGLGIGIWRIGFYQSDVDRGMAELRIAYRGQRPIEARSSANFEYAPLSETRGAPAKITDEKAYRRAELLLLEASNARASHALGLLYLSDKKFDEAINEFNTALSANPSDSKIQGDLGAAYFEKAKQDADAGRNDDSAKNLALSLKSLNRALEIDGAQLEPLFNRALVLEKLGADNQAREAWQKYLEKDAVSPWANEARSNLESLNKRDREPKDKAQILQEFLNAYQNRDDAKAWEIISQTKELISNVMIQPQLALMFLEASGQNRTTDAEQILSALQYVGELEKKNAGDVYFSELADFYRRSGQRPLLLNAHQELRKGYDLIIKPDFKQAVETLQNAKKMFQNAGNDWESSVAEYQIAYCLSRDNQIEESNKRLLELSKTAEQRSHKWIQVLADGWVGETYFFLGEPSKAAAYNQKSLELAEQISDNYNIHRITVQLMEEARSIGEEKRSLFFTYRNLTLSDSYYTSARQKWRDLNYAAEVFQRFKYYDAAVVFAEESAAVAENKAKDSWMLWTSRRNLAIIYGRLQNFPKAYEQTEQALRLSREFKGEVMRKRLTGNSLQTLAELQAIDGKCAPAVENYNQAIQNYQELNHVTYEYTARKGRLLCNIAEGNDAGVREELTVLLPLFDQNRKKITNEADRITFFSAEQEVYDAAAVYAYAKSRDTEQAFYYTESSRARSLLSLTSSNKIQPYSLTEIQQKIPSEIRILYYAVFNDRVLIWLISRTEIHVAEQSIPVAEMESRIQRYLQRVTSKSADDETVKLAKELFELLISPVADKLERDQMLCLIADKILFRVPFAALISPKTNRFLIEDHPLLSAPSATVFVNQTENSRQREQIEREEILSIGNPQFSRGNYPELADLPSARLEADKIGALYALDAAKILTGKKATKTQVLADLNNADVVHYAGHYVPNSKSPALSRLLLASEDLQVGEINRENLTRVRLLILSACDTGIENFYQGEGMIGAARAFLGTGVPLVVASQWSVDSDATADLMVKFHRYRKQQNMPTVAALRQAQIDMLTSENERFRHPYYWAAFLPIGGYANY